MKLKKMTALTLAGVMILPLTACGSASRQDRMQHRP